MPPIFEYHHTVQDDESDVLGHVNNVAYVDWLQSAAMAHSTAQGWPEERYTQSGFGWVVRAHKIEYLQPAFPGDRILVEVGYDAPDLGLAGPDLGTCHRDVQNLEDQKRKEATPGAPHQVDFLAFGDRIAG